MPLGGKIEMMEGAAPPEAPAQGAAPAPGTAMGAAPAAPRALSGEIEAPPSWATGATPDAPINESSLSAMERLELNALGNKAGRLKKLKEKFGEAQEDAQGNIVYKKDGLWHRMDPDGLGLPADPWELTKQLVRTSLRNAPKVGQLARILMPEDSELDKDIADMADVGAQAAVTGVASLAGPGATAAAAGLLETGRTSLGRLVGTYEADLTDQAKDIGWEMMLNGGLVKLGLGVKPKWDDWIKSFKEQGQIMTSNGKARMSGVYEMLGGVPRWAARRAMDASEKVIGKTKKAFEHLYATSPAKHAADPLEARNYLSKRQEGIVTTLAKAGRSALNESYETAKLAIRNGVDKTFTPDIDGSIAATWSELQQLGLGQYKKVVSSSGKVLKESFEMLDDDSFKRMASNPELGMPEALAKDVQKALKEYVAIMNRFKGINASGRKGAEALMQLKKNLNAATMDLVTPDTPASVAHWLKVIHDKMDTRIGNEFLQHKPEIFTAFKKMNETYASKANAVKLFEHARHTKDKGGVENLIKHLTQGDKAPGTRGHLQAEAAHLGDLLGKRGKVMLDAVFDYEAAKQFVDAAPKSLGGNSLVSAAKWSIGAMNSMPLVGRVTSTVVPDTQQAVARQVKYGGALLDFMKGLNDKTARQLFGDDKALGTAIMTAVQAADGEDQELANLLASTGVLPQGLNPGAQ